VRLSYQGGSLPLFRYVCLCDASEREPVRGLSRYEGEVMTYLLEMPVGEGSAAVVLFEVDAAEVPGELELASDEPGKAAARARRALDEVLLELAPSLRRILDGLRSLSPQDTTVEFGIKMGGETGVIIAKGTAEVNFKVTMTWRGAEP